MNSLARFGIAMALIFILIGCCVCAEKTPERVKVVKVGYIEPEGNRAGVTALGNASVLMNDSQEAMVVRAVFPNALATFTFVQDGSSIYTEPELKQYIKDRWTTEVQNREIAGYTAPSSVANAFMLWMHSGAYGKPCWGGPVGKALTDYGAYNFAIVYVGEKPVTYEGENYNTQVFEVARIYPPGISFDYGTQTATVKDTVTSLGTFYFAENVRTGGLEIVFVSGGPDESVVQVELTDC